MNKKLLVVLVAAFSAYAVQAKTRINNESEEIVYLRTSPGGSDRAQFERIPSNPISYKAMKGKVQDKYSYLHKGSFKGILWLQVNKNGNATYYFADINTKKALGITHLTITRNGSYTYKGVGGTAQKVTPASRFKKIGSK